MIDRPDWDRSVVPGTFTPGGSRAVILASTNATPLYASSLAIQVVVIKARRANAGKVYWGNSDVTADESASTGGYQLDPGDMVTVATRDLGNEYIRGAVGDGVTIRWYT